VTDFEVITPEEKRKLEQIAQDATAEAIKLGKENGRLRAAITGALNEDLMPSERQMVLEQALKQHKIEAE